MADPGVPAIRPGHRSLVRSWASIYLRTVLAEARGNATQEGFRATKIVTDDPTVAAKLRELATVATNSNMPVAQRLRVMRAKLDGLVTDTLNEHAPGRTLPSGRDDELFKEIAKLLEKPDEDNVFKQVTVFIRNTLSAVLKPLIPCPDHRRTPEEFINSLQMDVLSVVNKIRHGELDVPQAVDAINILIGWHLREAGVSKLDISQLIGLADSIDEKLQAYSQADPA